MRALLQRVGHARVDVAGDTVGQCGAGLLILVCAMLLDAALGEPPWRWRRLPLPAVLMGRLMPDTVTIRQRHGVAMQRALEALDRLPGLLSEDGLLVDLAAEELRIAILALDTLIGKVDVEDLLDEGGDGVPLGEHLGQRLRPQDVPQRRLRQQLRREGRVVDVRHRDRRVADVEVDHRVHRHRHTVLNKY